MTSLHLPPPSAIDPHYICVLLKYNMSQQWWLFLCLSIVGLLMPCELTWHLSPSSIVNETTLEVADFQEINITGADTTQWQLQGLKEGSLYHFLLSACTRAGCGPPLAQECSTTAVARECKISISGTTVWLKRSFAFAHYYWYSITWHFFLASSQL